MKDKTIKLFMDFAERTAKESKARRLQVGCIIVKDEERVISLGWNGTPPGWDNSCEFVVDFNCIGDKKLETKPEVIHAEANAIGKVAKSNESAKDADVFITHAPCIECAKILAVSGVRAVYYKYDYRSDVGIKHLKKCKVKVIKVKNDDE